MGYARYFIAVAGIVMITRPAFAQSPEIEALEKEIAELRSEVAALRYALSEIARNDKRSVAAIQRALGRGGAPAPEKSASRAPSLDTPTETDGTPPPPPPPRKKRTTTVAKSNSTGGTGIISGRVELPAGEPVSYVYVDNIRGRLVRGKSVRVDQSGKQFRPRWAVIERGTTVEFPNLDNIYHNVFSRSRNNTFDLGLYRKGDENKSHRFLKSGSVDVFCNIHPQMSANILVVPNNYFAKVGDDGAFAIRDVPAGRRKVVAWAPGSTPRTEWVEVTAGGTSSLQVKLAPRGGAHKNKFGRPYGSYP